MNDEIAAERVVREMARLGLIKINDFGFIETHDGHNWGTPTHAARAIVALADKAQR